MFALPGMLQAFVQMTAMPYAIGRFVMEWSIHERKISLLASRVFERPYEAIRDELLSGPTNGFQRMVERIVSMFADGDLGKSLAQDLAEKQRGFIDLRHQIVHGFWEGQDGNSYYIKKMRKDGTHFVRNFDADEIIKESSDLNQLGLLAMRVENEFLKTRGMPPRYDLHD